MREFDRLVDNYRLEIRARLGIHHGSALPEDHIVAFQVAALTIVAELTLEHTHFPASLADVRRLADAMAAAFTREAALLRARRTMPEVAS